MLVGGIAFLVFFVFLLEPGVNVQLFDRLKAIFEI